jgi:hypothetical protein
VIAVDECVQRAVKRVARRNDSYFTVNEIVTETVKQRRISEAIVGLRHQYRGLGLDEAVMRYIEGRVARELRDKDAHGIRRYECYATGNGERRWRRFSAMNAADVSQVLRDLRALDAELRRKIALYEQILAAMERQGPNARVVDVYDEVVDGVLDIERDAA